MSVPFEQLRGLCLFRTLGDDIVKQIAAAASPLKFYAGEVLYSQGAATQGLYVVQTGHVKLLRQSGDKTQILVVLHSEGAFGAETLFAGAPCPCSAQALTAGSAIRIPADALSELLEQHPDFLLAFLELISQRLRLFANLVHSLAFRDVPTRLAEVLLQHEWRETPNGIIIPRLLSQQDLAAHVGTAREVIYRTLKKFEHDGLIQILPAEYVVLDAGRLLELAEREI